MRRLILLLLLLCTSCIQIGSAPPAMNYYLLESLTEPLTAPSGISSNIHIELKSFPEYLDRLQIVTYNGHNGINFRENERWAEPVQDNLMRVIRENLSFLIPGSVISVGPWESASDNAIIIELVFNQFSGQLEKHTQVDIRWTIDKGSAGVKQGCFTDQQPVGEKYQDLIIGLNNGINFFSRELAKSLATE